MKLNEFKADQLEKEGLLFIKHLLNSDFDALAHLRAFLIVACDEDGYVGRHAKELMSELFKEEVKKIEGL